MDSIKPIYEFTFNPNTYEYIACNAAFYEFRGSNNIYDTMDANLLVDESHDKLRQMVSDCAYDRTFTLVVADHAKAHHLVACRLVKQDSDDAVGIMMIEVDRLFDDYCSLQISEREADALLSQYECTYFSYNCGTDMITSYTYDLGKSILSERPLDEWVQMVKDRIMPGSHDTFDVFASNIRAGTRSFDCPVTCTDDGKIMVFTGSAVYNEDTHIRTVGRIGDPHMTSAREAVRRDQLTGLLLKETITNYAKRRIDEQKKPTILAIIDIDDFKNVNDGFGHAKGDEVLKKCASIIADQSEEYGKAGRIGGDEFFVVFDKGGDFDSIKNVLRGIKNTIYSAYSDEQDGFHVSTSIGLSIYPNDIDGSFDTMFQLADCLLYRAKRKGKNRWIVYNAEKHGSVEDILKNGVQKVGLSGMRGIDKSELVCKITNMMLCGTSYPVPSIMYDIMTYFSVERVVLYNKTDGKVESQCGDMLFPEAELSERPGFLYDAEYNALFDNDVLLINNIKYLEYKIPSVYTALRDRNVLSFIQCTIKGDSGKDYVISFDMVKTQTTWNQSDTSYLRILTKVMEKSL